MSVVPSDIARLERDRVLIEAHCAGDPAAFPVIVRDHYVPLLAQAHRRLGSRVEAEDAVQETFERAYRGLCRVNGEYRIGAWLRRILSNVCTDHATRRQVQRALPERIGAGLGDTPDVAEHASDPIVFRAVRAALDALPANQRQTFWLHEMEGLTYPEVALQLGISEDNARARVHRAKEALRRSLARTRDAVAAMVAVPLGARVLMGRGKKLSVPLPDNAPVDQPAGVGPELAHGATTAVPGLQGGVTHVAYAISVGPVSDLAAVSSSGAPRALMVIAASVAAAFGGILTVPAVTGSSGSSTAPSSVSAEIPAGEGRSSDGSETNADDPVVEVSVEPEPVPVSTPQRFRNADWIIAGAGAGAAGAEPEPLSWSDAPETSMPSAGSPGPDVCPWVADYPDILTAPTTPASVTGTFETVEKSVEAGTSISWWSDTTLHIAETTGGPTVATTLTLRTQVCLERGRAAIVIDAGSMDDQRAQLRGARVLRLSDRVSLFRGRVVVPPDAPNGLTPWHLPEHFVARFEVDPTTGTVRLDVAFLGEPAFVVPPTTAPVPPTTAPVPPTTAPVPPTTAPVPPTTAPVPPTTTATTQPLAGSGPLP